MHNVDTIRYYDVNKSGWISIWPGFLRNTQEYPGVLINQIDPRIITVCEKALGESS